MNIQFNVSTHSSSTLSINCYSYKITSVKYDVFQKNICFHFLASASMAGSFIHFRSLYKTTAPNIVPYVATTNYNRQERIASYIRPVYTGHPKSFGH